MIVRVVGITRATHRSKHRTDAVRQRALRLSNSPCTAHPTPEATQTPHNELQSCRRLHRSLATTCKSLNLPTLVTNLGPKPYTL